MSIIPDSAVKKRIKTFLIILSSIICLLSVIAKYIVPDTDKMFQSGKKYAGTQYQTGYKKGDESGGFPLFNILPGSDEVRDDQFQNPDRIQLAGASNEKYRNEIMTALVEEASRLDDLPHYTWYPTRFESVDAIDRHIANLKRIVILSEAVQRNEASEDERVELLKIKTAIVKEKIDDSRAKCDAMKTLPRAETSEEIDLQQDDQDRCSVYIGLLEKKIEYYRYAIDHK